MAVTANIADTLIVGYDDQEIAAFGVWGLRGERGGQGGSG
jgi:hypothetical protein